MTVRHIVLFTLKPGISSDDARVAAAAELSESHRYHISEILSWWTGFNIGSRVISADFAIVGTFENMDAVNRYMDNPHHRLGVSAWGAIATWIVIDAIEKEPQVTPNA